MIDIVKISKKYNPRSNKEVKAVNKICLSFKDNGMIFILGPSGCGKTTLLNILGGIDIPAEGEIVINDFVVGKTEEELDSYRNQHVGFVFQDFNLIETMSIYDNLALVCFSINENEIKDKINYYLEKVGLKGHENRFPNELSGGQIQRVAIARALLKDSTFILADEPTGNLNNEMSKEIFSLFKSISKEKLVIIVSHNEQMAYEYADRVIKLKDGEVIGDEEINPIENNNLNNKFNTRISDKKNIFKMAIKNIKSSILDVVFSSLILFLCFICISTTFSIVNYNRIDTDIKNIETMDEIETFGLERYSYEDTLARTISYAQADQIKNDNPEMVYIQDGIISSSNDLFNFGLELYDNYNEISNDGIYVFEYIIKQAIQNGKLYYDNFGVQFVENTDEIKYDLLTNTFLLYEKYGIKKYVKIDGIVKNLTDPRDTIPFISNEETAKHYYYLSFQRNISTFYKKGSIYDKEIYKEDYMQVYSSYIDGPKCVSLNDVQLENKYIYFSDVMHGNFQATIGDLILTDNALINNFNADSDEELFKVQNENEIYISLSLYNQIFNEYSEFDYYVNKIGFRKYEINNYPKHIGEKISFEMLDYYFKDYSLNYSELVIKGIILDENSQYYCGAIISSDKYNEIYNFSSKPNIYVKKESITNISAFVNNCQKVKVRPNYICSDEIDNFENNVQSLKFIFSVLSFIFTIVAFLVMYSFINRLIKKKTKEVGILKAIGMCNKDIVNIFYVLVLIISLFLIIVTIPLSIISITLINNIVVSNVYQGLTIIFYKWWYSVVTVLFIFIVIILSSTLIISKFRKLKAIELIKNTQ